MKFIYMSILIIALISDCAFSADSSSRVKSEETTSLLLGAGHGPDSEEKMAVAAILKGKNNAGLDKLRADSPYPQRIKALDYIRLLPKSSKSSNS